MRPCPFCSRPLDPEALFCTGCGAALRRTGPEPGSAERGPRGVAPILASIIGGAVRRFAKRLPLALFVMAAIFALYFYLVVVKYEGWNFSAGALTWWERALGLAARESALTRGISAGLVIGIVITLVIAALRSLRDGRLGAAVTALPSRWAEAARAAQSGVGLALAAGGGLGLALSSLVSGFAAWTLALGIAAMAANPSAVMPALLFNDAMTRPPRSGSRPWPPGKPETGRGRVALLGIAVGAVMGAYIGEPGEETWRGTAGIAVSAIAIVMGRGGIRSIPVAPGLFIATASAGLVGLMARRALADDGGWVEGGGNLEQWWQSPGAQDLFWDLVTSAAGAGLGAGVTSALATVLTSTPPAATVTIQTPTATPGTELRSGDAALQWLRDHGLIGDDGRPTPLFHQWQSQLPSSSGPDPTGLEGFAGDLDPNAPVGPGVAILIRSGTPPLPPPPPPVPVKPPPVKPPPVKPPPVQPPPPAPPPTTRIEEPSTPEPEPEPPKPPCHEDLRKLRKTTETLRKLRLEKGRLERKLQRMEVAWENARQAGLHNGVIDVLLVGLSNLPLGQLAVKTRILIQGAGSLIAEAVRGALGSYRSGSWDFGSKPVMSSILQAIQEATQRALEKEGLASSLAAPLAQSISNIFATSSAAKSVRRSMDRCETIRKRISTVQRTLSKTKSVIETVEVDHEINVKFYGECLKRQGVRP